MQTIWAVVQLSTKYLEADQDKYVKCAGHKIKVSCDPLQL